MSTRPSTPPEAPAADLPGSPHPKIVRLIAYWRSLAPGPGLLPGRQHFDPLHLPDLLPHLLLLDVLAGPPRRYRYRLIGGGIVDAGWLARKGDFVDDPRLSDDPAAAMRPIDRVVESKQPDWHHGGPMVQHAKQVTKLERVFLPLARDGASVDMVIGMTLYYWIDGRVY